MKRIQILDINLVKRSYSTNAQTSKQEIEKISGGHKYEPGKSDDPTRDYGNLSISL
jgi:hypothetical protein